MLKQITYILGPSGLSAHTASAVDGGGIYLAITNFDGDQDRECTTMIHKQEDLAKLILDLQQIRFDWATGQFK